MINVAVKTNTVRRTVSADITDTPRKVFDDLGVDISTSMVNLNGAMADASNVNKSFEALGVEDGSTAYLNAIVKADGATAA